MPCCTWGAYDHPWMQCGRLSLQSVVTMPELVLTKNLAELKGRWEELRECAEKITGSSVALWEIGTKTFIDFQNEAHRKELAMTIFLRFL